MKGNVIFVIFNYMGEWNCILAGRELTFSKQVKLI